MMAGIELSIQGQKQLSELARRIKAQAEPRVWRKDTLTALRTEMTPGVLAAREAALNLPARRSRKRTLRARTAAATSAQVSLRANNPTLSIRVTRGRMGDKGPVPQLMDRPRFRHRVFGREQWVEQTGKYHWFEAAVHKRDKEVVRKLEMAIDTMLKRMVK